MKYKLVWLDTYSAFNAYRWSDNFDGLLDEEKEKDFDDIVKHGIKNIQEGLPNSEVENIGIDGWVDICAWDYIEANNMAELKKNVNGILSENGRIIDVFNVLDENNNRVLTEEDF